MRPTLCPLAGYVLSPAPSTPVLSPLPSPSVFSPLHSCYLHYTPPPRLPVFIITDYSLKSYSAIESNSCCIPSLSISSPQQGCLSGISSTSTPHPVVSPAPSTSVFSPLLHSILPVFSPLHPPLPSFAHILRLLVTVSHPVNSYALLSIKVVIRGCFSST